MATQSPSSTASAAEPGEAADPTRDRTSWWPRDLAAVLAGTGGEPEPSHLAREDGRRLFYAAKVNGLIGESESGKTWVALLAVVQALAGAEQVVYLDFEDVASGIVARLRSLGVPDEQLARLAYIGPDESLHLAASADLSETLEQLRPGLIVLDGFNAAMTLLGLDLNSNTDATKFAQTLLRPLAATGACVVYVDHVPKNVDNRGKGGIGAQAKRAMTTGCALRVDVVKPFGRGMTGRLKLWVDKDRPGHVRAAAGGATYAGTAELVSDGDSGMVTVRVQEPDSRPPEERPKFRPTHLMQRVSQLLASLPEGASKSAIEAEIGGKASYVRGALDCLIEEGYVTTESLGNGRAITHKLARPYFEINDLIEGSDGA